MDRPLITFMIIAYNQERFIREAVEGAFSQTYSPLEIILSDDCSPDSTFEIMEEMAGAYNGPHKIRLNCNGKNLGISGHINRIMELAQGELIVGSAGDDVSLPDRSEVIFESWEASGRSAFSLYSSFFVIDEESKGSTVCQIPYGPFAYDPFFMVEYDNPGVPGASHAWHRDVFRRFGPLLEGISCEDRVIPFRSLLLGKIVSIEKPLVKYRRHEGNFDFTQKVRYPILNLHRATKAVLENTILHTQSYLKDAEFYAPHNEKLLAFIRNRKHVLHLQYEMITASFGGRLRALFVASHLPIRALVLFTLALKYLFPIPYNAYCILRYGKQMKSWDRFLAAQTKKKGGM